MFYHGSEIHYCQGSNDILVYLLTFGLKVVKLNSINLKHVKGKFLSE